jgi:thiamine-phosphate pyrophosphorylase
MVSDRRRFGDRAEDALVERVAAAARAGVDLVQIRERDLDARDLCRLVTRCVEATQGTHTRVLVNDRLDVAMAAGAHGVHLRADSVPASRVREIVSPGFLVGRSVHDARQAAAIATAGGVDYLLFGTVFVTSSKPGVPAAGVEELTRAAAASAVPVLAIGGVTLESVHRLGRSGAAGIAAIGLFAEAAPDKLPDIVAQVSRTFQDID